MTSRRYPASFNILAVPLDVYQPRQLDRGNEFHYPSDRTVAGVTTLKELPEVRPEERAAVSIRCATLHHYHHPGSHPQFVRRVA
jgi:hypothetical protein